jgi:hypothetical protein
MIATGVGHRFHSAGAHPGVMDENETHEDQDRAAILEALARQSSVANPRRTRR